MTERYRDKRITKVRGVACVAGIDGGCDGDGEVLYFIWFNCFEIGVQILLKFFQIKRNKKIELINTFNYIPVSLERIYTQGL